jgi:hypothetical protein
MVRTRVRTPPWGKTLLSHKAAEHPEKVLQVESWQFWGAAQSDPSQAPGPHTSFIISSVTLQNTVGAPVSSLTTMGYAGSGICAHFM